MLLAEKGTLTIPNRPMQRDPHAGPGQAVPGFQEKMQACLGALWSWADGHCFGEQMYGVVLERQNEMVHVLWSEAYLKE